LSVRNRFAIAGLLTAFVVVSLVRYLLGEPSTGLFFRVILGILIWTPAKGALLRFMGGKRPNWSALAANAASELPSLGFPLSPLGVPWPALTASFFISTYIEWLALIVMGTARVRSAFIMALYINIFAHVLVVGFLLWPDGHLLSAAIIFGSFLIFIFPIFVKFVPTSAETKSR
jgi:hypothetical protein